MPRSMVEDINDVIVRTLAKMEAYHPAMNSVDAKWLILRTMAQESLLQHLKQINGPAVSFAQIEPNTAWDIYENYLRYKKNLLSVVDEIAGGEAWRTDKDTMALAIQDNIALSVAMARLVYWRAPGAIPPMSHLLQQAHYWKDHYNTYLGKGKPEQFIANAELLHIA